MDFLLTIKNSPYFHWQAELLIESFKMHNLSDKLCIAMEHTDKPFDASKAKNLISHKRKFSFIGQKKEYLNHPYGVYLAIKENHIKMPITVLHADMVLVKEPTEPKTNIVFSGDQYWLDDIKNIKQPIEERLKRLSEDKQKQLKKSLDFKLLPMGGVYQFDKVSLSFFEKVIRWGGILMEELDTSDAHHAERAAWMLANYEEMGLYSFNGNYDLEMVLPDHNKVANFIHYSKGIPPYFNKRMFKDDEGVFMASRKTPFEMLKEYNPTTTTNYLNKVIESYEKFLAESN